METATQFKKRIIALLAWLALFVIGVSFALYFAVDVRRQEAVAAEQEATRQAEKKKTEKLEAQLTDFQKGAEANAKLRAALRGRLDEANGKKLSADDEKLFARIRELLAPPATTDGLAKQDENLRAALKEAIAAADLREFRAANAAIEREVEAARGLKFKTPVVYHTMKVADFPDYVRHEIRAQYTEQEFRDYGRALAFLGLLPEGSDLEKLYLDVMGEQVGAFYDEKKQHLVTFSDRPSSTGIDQMILAHELTHALDDQNFPIKDFGLDRKDNDDLSRAASALIEGNATMVMGQVYLQHAAKAGVGSALKDIGAMFRQNTEQFNKAPPFIQQSLMFPYMQGQQFILALVTHGDGSMDAVNDAFRHPPVSTTQILHPDKYFAHEEPKEIKLPDLAKEKGWKLLSNNVVGEFGIQVLLGANAAAGWNGDRYAVWEVAPNELAMLWISAWDVPPQAHAFADAFTAWAQKNRRTLTIQRKDGDPAVTVIAARSEEILETIRKAAP